VRRNEVDSSNEAGLIITLRQAQCDNKKNPPMEIGGNN